MKVAYLGFPHLGGTFTAFKTMRAGLKAFNIDCRWVAVARPGRLGGIAQRFPEELQAGEIVGDPLSSEADAAAALCRHLELAGYEAVMVNVLSERIEMNAVRYLAPADLLRVMVVHNTTPGTYAAALALRPYVHSTVAVCPRAQADLLARGFTPERTHVITNAPLPVPMTRVARTDALRVLFLGRISDTDKGVLWLPAIATKLSAPAEFTIVGDGPDLHKLKAAAARTGSTFNFLGALPHKEIASVLAASDVLLMPSRFEGLPLALIEAMQSGVVPVASRLRGVTDFVVDHLDNGFLFKVGDTSAAAAWVERLATDRRLLQAMSARAAQQVEKNFSMKDMARRYADVLGAAAQARTALAAPQRIEQWSIPLGFRRGLRSFLPQPIKSRLRALNEVLR